MFTRPKIGKYQKGDVGVSKNNRTPKSSILMGFSIINHPFWGTPIFGNTHVQGIPMTKQNLRDQSRFPPICISMSQSEN